MSAFRLVFKTLSFVVVASLISACGSTNSRLRERAQIEGEETAKKSIEAENSNRERRVTEMENDLQKRQTFYKALEGTYVGERNWGGLNQKLQVVIKPSLSVYRPDRIRTVEEVETDLTSLFLNVQMVSDTEGGTVGCLFSNIRPDLQTGVMNLFSENCNSFPFFYTLKLSDENSKVDESLSDSSRVAGTVLKGSIGQIQKLMIEERAKNSRAQVVFNVDRNLSDSGSPSKLKTDREIEAEKDIAAQNENLRKRVAEMETDLEQRHKFYDALLGTYDGEYPKILSDGSKLQARVTISKTIPYLKPMRQRTPEEVAADLHNLSLIVQLNLWDSEISTGCLFQNVKPDLTTGILNTVSDTCSRAVTLSLGTLPAETADLIHKSKLLLLPTLNIEERWKFTGETLTYSLNRKEIKSEQ